MLRSLYSGVAGLKTHQTKMDVIGNNISNVNTTSFKSSSITFSDLMSQTTQAASGATATTGGTNAKQIGLGVKSGAITASITTQGSAQSTGNPFDIMITGENFFVVKDSAGATKFTRDGSFYVDGNGDLAMTSTGYRVQGWQPSTENPNEIKQDTVSALRIMSEANMTYPPEATTIGTVAGILDKNDPDIATESGKTLNLNFYDALGYSYTGKFSVHETSTEGEYSVQLDDILDSNGNSILDTLNIASISDIAKFGTTQVNETTELKELLSGYEYDSAGKVIKHTLSKSDALTDYDSTKVAGVEYTFTDGDVAAGAKVTATGKGTVTKSDLETIYNLVYYKDTTVTPAAYAYYEKDDVTGTGKKISTADDWKTVLGLNNVTSVTVDAEGNVNFELTQDFTAGTQKFTIASGKFDAELDAKDNDILKEAYGITDTKATYVFDVAPDGQAQVTRTETITGNVLKFDKDSGVFQNIAGGDSVIVDFNTLATDRNGNAVTLENFSDITVDFSQTSMYNNNKTSTLTATSGDKDGLGSGRMLGKMIGVSTQSDGKIIASYDNGMTKLLGQIATANFANASGLSKEGDNLYSATTNSGEFNGIGVDITASGGYMSTGVLEMSNVDLSTEFTNMITTQRGFQANSRIITVSDTLIEELTNLKR